MDTKKIIWIIGASSGIGKSLALLLARSGHSVAISSRSAALLETISNEHDNLYAFPLDVMNKESLNSAKNKILNDLGSITSLFINAGDYSPMPLEGFSPELFEQLISINYLGVVNSLDTVLPHMLEKKSGEIYVTASLAGYRGLPNSAAYNASKAAVISLVESLHIELKNKGISLRLINPGFVKSPLTRKNDFEMPFLITPEKAAQYIYREMPHNNFEITFPKRFAWIMKFMRILPYKVYFFLTKKLADNDQ